MNFHSLRSSLAGTFLAVAASLILTSCGGGGATTNPGQGGAFQIIPAAATFYAGVPATIQILGGRGPYAVSSSDPGVLPVPTTLNGNSFEVVPNNPGVVDTGLTAGELPVRSVTVTARETGGASAQSVIKVGQNFLLGYNVTFSTTTCTAAAGAATAAQACAGGQTLVTVSAVFNGNLQGDRQLTFQAIQGPYGWVFPATGAVGNSINVVTDHFGTASAILQVNPNVGTQIAVLRVLDTATGVYQDTAFLIAGSPNAGTLTVIPTTFTFGAALASQCGTGQGTVVVLDGTPPYMAVSTDPNVRVTPASSPSNPGQFTISASNPNICLTSASVVITDSTPGNPGRGTVTVTTTQGTTALPALAASPTSLTLVCGGTGSVSVVGGSGSYSASSSLNRVTAVVSGSTVSITRLTPDPPAPPYPTTVTVSVSDGTSLVPITVTIPATCP